MLTVVAHPKVGAEVSQDAAVLPSKLLGQPADRLLGATTRSKTSTYDEFVLRSPLALEQIVDEASDGQVLVDSAQSVEELASSHEFVGFWAGPVGFVGFAEDIEAITFAGALSCDEIEQRHRQWWEYWKEYWQRRESADPMPGDYACEVTIPRKQQVTIWLDADTATSPSANTVISDMTEPTVRSLRTNRKAASRPLMTSTETL